jgi:hypothetical protein
LLTFGFWPSEPFLVWGGWCLAAVDDDGLERPYSEVVVAVSEDPDDGVVLDALGEKFGCGSSTEVHGFVERPGNLVAEGVRVC